MASKVRIISDKVWELRFYHNPRNYNVVGRYSNPGLAYGMRKKKNAEAPLTFPLNNLKVVPV